MAAAMYVPFLILFPPMWAGVIDVSAVSGIGHVLMLPAMAGVMLLRPAEYMLPHAHHRRELSEAGSAAQQ